jgi:hypothetical protein
LHSSIYVIYNGPATKYYDLSDRYPRKRGFRRFSGRERMSDSTKHHALLAGNFRQGAAFWRGN